MHIYNSYYYLIIFEIIYSNQIPQLKHLNYYLILLSCFYFSTNTESSFIRCFTMNFDIISNKQKTKINFSNISRKFHQIVLKLNIIKKYYFLNVV